MSGDASTRGLKRQFGLLQATALNVTMIVGAGIFMTVPLMRKELPGPYLWLGWALGAVLMMVDGLVWAELGAAMPSSGGSYLYLLESYGRKRWGRAAAFLFIWQFMISGPLELGSGLIAMAGFAPSISQKFANYNEEHTINRSVNLNEYVPAFLRTGNPTEKSTIGPASESTKESSKVPIDKSTSASPPSAPTTTDDDNPVNVGITISPARYCVLSLGVLMIVLLYRRITALGKLTVLLWIGVLAVIGWVLFEGFRHGNPSMAFASFGTAKELPVHFASKVGAIVSLAMYSYLGYYNVCYIGDEVHDPGRTMPRSIVLSALLVAVLFISLHVAMLSVVPWNTIPTDQKQLDDYSLPAKMMETIYGKESSAMTIVSVLLIWSCFGSAFAGMLGYARIPYGAARQGHFYAALARVHSSLQIPHVSLLLIGGMTLFWTFFDLDSVIKILIVTRILEQFIAQIVGVMILRRTRPDMHRPYKIWLYPLPCFLAILGWLAVYLLSDRIYIALGLLTMTIGIAAFLLWSRISRSWPFAAPEAAKTA
jgi:amino acid transporter